MVNLAFVASSYYHAVLQDVCSRIGSPPSNSISIEFVDHGASMSNHYYYSALTTLDPLDHASIQGAFGGAWHIIF